MVRVIWGVFRFCEKFGQGGWKKCKTFVFALSPQTTRTSLQARRQRLDSHKLGVGFQHFFRVVGGLPIGPGGLGGLGFILDTPDRAGRLSYYYKI